MSNLEQLVPSNTRLDVDSSIFFNEQLNYIFARTYRYEYPQMKSFRLIPVSYDVPAGAEYVSMTQFQSVGRARVINSYADDLPNVGLAGLRIQQPIVSIGDSYRYSRQEIRAAQFARVDLDGNLAITAREAIEQKMNDLAFTGNAVTGATGFLNNPNIPTYTVPADGVGAQTEWSTKTPEQILRDMNELVTQIVGNTNGVERPDTLLLPIAQYSYIASTPRSPNSDTTILQYFLLNNEFITTVVWVPQLAGAGAGGADIMIAYRNDPRKLQMFIPMPFTQYPAQERNLEFVINCEARFGGVVVMYPQSVNIGEGI